MQQDYETLQEGIKRRRRCFNIWPTIDRPLYWSLGDRFAIDPGLPHMREAVRESYANHYPHAYQEAAQRDQKDNSLGHSTVLGNP